MANQTCLNIPSELLQRAKELNINVSETSREALEEKIRRKENERRN